MKKTLLLLMILLSLAVPAKAQLNPDQIQDIDAYEYIRINNVSDPQAIKDINAWFLGLKYLQIYTNVLYMADLRSHHGAFQWGATYPEGSGNEYYGVTTNNQPIAPMIGTNALTFMQGATRVTSRGIQFTNNVSQSVIVSNVFGSPLSELSMVSVGQMKYTGAATAIWGAYESSTKRGPQMFAHGSPSAGVLDGRFHMNLSGSGTTNFANSSSTPGLVGSFLVPKNKSAMFISTYNTTEVKCASNIEVPYATTGTYESSVYNGSTYWYIGKTGDNALPIDGEVSMVILFNKALCYTEMASLRRLYQITIGKGILPENIIHFEGDSLTAGSGNQTVWRWFLETDDALGTSFMGRNMSTGGENTVQMLSQVYTNLYPFNVDIPFSKNSYYFIYGGINDSSSEVAQDSYIRLQKIWKLAKDVGYKVVAFTMTGSDSLDANGREKIRNLNRMIRNSNGQWDKLVDLELIPEMQPAGTNNQPLYYIDAVHYTTTGHRRIAEEIKRAIGKP